MFLPLEYAYALGALRALEHGIDPEKLRHILKREHASVSADPPNGTKERVANACCNKFDECSPEPEYVSARFILFADRPDAGAEPEAPAVPLLFKDWMPSEEPKGPITVFYKSHEFPGVSWGQERKRSGGYSYLVYPSTTVKPLLRLPKGSDSAQSLIHLITGAREKKNRMETDLMAVVTSLKRQSL